MSEQEHRLRLRNDLFQKRFIPALEQQRTHVTLTINEITDLYDGLEIQFILDGLGHGWMAVDRMGGSELVIFVCQLQFERAIKQITDIINQPDNSS